MKKIIILLLLSFNSFAQTTYKVQTLGTGEKVIYTFVNGTEQNKELWTQHRENEVRAIRVNDIQEYMKTQLSSADYKSFLADTRTNADADYDEGDDTFLSWVNGAVFPTKTYYSLARKTFILSILNP